MIRTGFLSQTTLTVVALLLGQTIRNTHKMEYDKHLNWRYNEQTRSSRRDAKYE